jgi:hypothetical protein
MNRGTIIELLNQGHITSVKDLRRLKVPYRAAGSGAFRMSYIIFPKDEKEHFVIKFPGSEFGSIKHTQDEIRAIRKIKNTLKLAFLRPFLPTILYSNYRSGIIAMEYYYKCKDCSAVAYTLSMAYEELNPYSEADIEYYNIRETGNGDYKLIDLGCFEY